MADTGWMKVRTGLSISLAGSHLRWSNEERIYDEDGSKAKAEYRSDGTAYSEYIIGCNVDASFIPDDAVIAGVEVRGKLSSDTASEFYDYKVCLRLASGLIGVTSKARAASTYWPTTAAWVTWGAADNLWGETLSKADLINSNFGVAIAVGAVSLAGSADAYVDAVEIKVTYTTATTGSGGEPVPADPLPTAPTGGLHLSVGTYKYGYSFYNNHTGVESDLQCDEDIIPPIVITAGKQDYVRLGGFTTIAVPLQANYIKIYRTLVGGSIYFYVGYLERSGATYQFPEAFIDSHPDTQVALQKQSPVVGHDMPPQGVTLYEYNDRLFGFASTGEYVSPTLYPLAWSSVDGREKLWFSSLDSCEYWPQQALDPTNILSYPQGSGGYIAFGSRGSSITSVCAEVATNEAQNQRGTSLLVLKETPDAYRLFGYDWSDFQKQAVANIDCLSNCAVNTTHGTAWVSSKGPVLLPYGANNEVRLYEKLFPILSTPFMEYVSSTFTRSIAAGVWNDWFMFSCAKGSTAVGNDHTFVYHLPTGTWYQLGDDTNLCGVTAFSWWNGPGDVGELYTSDAAAPKLWQLFKKVGTASYWDGAGSGVAWNWKTGLLMPNGDEMNTVREHQVEELAFLVRTPAADQTVYPLIYSNVCGSGTASTALVALASEDDPWQWLRWYSPMADAPWAFQLGMSGVATEVVTCEEVRIRFRDQSRQR